MKRGVKTEQESFVNVWPKETDFSDWLMCQDALDAFCKDIGLPKFVDPKREYPVTEELRVDVYAKTESNEVVVIENQRTRSDQKHLGQLVEYAAKTNAKIAILTATKINESVRTAVEWLNENCIETKFYLVKLETYRKGKERYVAFVRKEPK